MILGVGVDILNINQLNKEYLRKEDSFVRMTYTGMEYEQAMERDIPLHYFATRFAGKEAVYKALNWNGGHIVFHDIEILNQNNGQPYVTLHGKVKEQAESMGIDEVMLSLSYDTDYAVAYAIAQSKKGTISDTEISLMRRDIWKER